MLFAIALAVGFILFVWATIPSLANSPILEPIPIHEIKH